MYFWLITGYRVRLEPFFRFVDLKQQRKVMELMTPYPVTATMPFSILPKLLMYWRFFT